MEIPFEILALFVVLTFGLSAIGAWKRIPFALVLAGALMTFVFILTDNVIITYEEPLLKKTQHNTLNGTTTYQYFANTTQPVLYELDMWFKIVFMLFGTILMIGGALVWKTMED